MTANEMKPTVGCTVLVQVESWVVPMIVKDAKTSWNKLRLLVEPVEGSGQAWIELSRLRKWPTGEISRNTEIAA